MTPHQRAWFGALRFKLANFETFNAMDNPFINEKPMGISGGKTIGESIKVMISAAKVRNDKLAVDAAAIEQKHIQAGEAAAQELASLSADADALLSELGQVSNGGPVIDHG